MPALLLSLVLLAAACGSEGPTLERQADTPPGETQPPPMTTPPMTTPPSVLRGIVGEPGGSGAATRLRGEPECGPGDQPVVHLSWRPARDPGRAQVLAVTAFSNGFETGNFSVSRSLRPRVSTIDWTEVDANAAYTWRVLTRHGAEWTPSKTGGFTGPSCGVADMG
jgi:hypothetical protein